MESEAKRAKADEGLQPEAQWAARHPTVTLKLLGPNGENINVPGVTIMTTVKDLKTQLPSDQLGGLAANKMKLSTAKLGVLKDNLTLAHYNFSEGENVIVGLKERGGRK